MAPGLILTGREREYLAIALSNYADVSSHLRGRVDELLDLALKLDIPACWFSKGLRKQFEARSTSACTPEGAIPGPAKETSNG